MRVGIKVFITLLMMILLVLLVGSFNLSRTPVVQAQGTNLLQNPRFDPTGWYTKEGVDGQIPGGWDIWGDGVTAATDYNQFLPYTRSAPGSWVLKGGFVAWTGGGLQSVTVVPGTVYRFTIYGFVWTCNDMDFSCTGPEGRSSDTSFGGRVKVGVDPTGGTNALAGTVLWTTPQDAYDAFYPLTVDVTAETTQLTVFFYSTVSVAPALRETYWDDASLVALPEGEGSPINGGGSAPGDPTAEPPQTVPFVSPQSAQPDGSVVHVVGEGDTFDSVYVAYREFGVTRADILALNGWDEPPRWIFPGESIRIMPPGSVDPVTGQLLPTSAAPGINPTVTPITAGVGDAGGTPTAIPESDGGGGDFEIVKGG